MLNLPGEVDAEPVGQLHLVQRLLEQSELGALEPGPRQLMLVEYAELHGRFSLACSRLHNVISVLVLVKLGVVLCWRGNTSCRLRGAP